MLRDGTAFHSRCDAPKGDIYKTPLTGDEVLDMFYRNIEFSGVMTHERAEEIVSLVSHLEELENICELLELMK